MIVTNYHFLYFVPEDGTKAELDTNTPLMPDVGEIVTLVDEKTGGNREYIVQQRRFYLGQSHMTVEIILEE
jgi:hypothetical protein